MMTTRLAQKPWVLEPVEKIQQAVLALLVTVGRRYAEAHPAQVRKQAISVVKAAQ